MRKRRVKVDYGWDGGGARHPALVGVSSTESTYSTSTTDQDIIESGPSRITIDDLERLDREREQSRERGFVTRQSSQRVRRRKVDREGEERLDLDTVEYSEHRRTSRRRRKIPTIVPIVTSLALIPSILAAPTRTATDLLLARQTQASASSSYTAPDPLPTDPQPRLDEEPVDYDIKYLTSMSTPTHALPTDVYVVDERRLPFYMTQNEAGEWTKVDNAWFMYGRRAGDVSTANFSPDDDPSATAVPTTPVTGTSQFAITDNLPPGWGIEATRSNFYITPLIVAMSITLALMIVAGIIFIVIKRRKEHRRAKRRAARLRRKALAAAGLTEEDINNDRGGNGIDSALREKLEEIDKLTRGKHGSAPGNSVPKQRKERERGPTALIRTKVRSWNQGVGLLRRRKGGLGPTRSNTPSIEVIDDDKYDHRNTGRGSSDTERTTPTVASHSSNDRAGTSGSGSGEATTSDTNETPSSSELSRTVTQPLPPTGANGTATYFPPAYRPASVRSLQMRPPPASSSSRPNQTSGTLPSDSPEGSGETDVTTHSPREKTNAPGYYPAPATEDSEVALAVASRSDGKRRMDVAPPSDEEEEEANRIRHIATDDKQVLERMRMGASAPPTQLTAGFAGAGNEEEGPSAPEVEVDEQGFERHDPAILHVPPPLEEGEGSSSQFPRPPPQRPNLSYRLYSQDDLAASLGVDDHHLVPSAPPPAHPDHMAPSAPPLHLGEELSVPSAPAFPEDDHDHDHNHSFENDESGADGGDEYTRTDTNDTRDSDESAPSAPVLRQETAAEEEEEEGDRAIPEGQTRNPSLPLYEP